MAERGALKVVLFSGGRGSRVLSEELLARPQIRLTLAINGYDDGLSTGAVRRLLGDCLGPSDFRKNASRLARALSTCPPALVGLLDLRLPDGATAATVAVCLGLLHGDAVEEDAFTAELRPLVAPLEAEVLARLVERLARFEAERDATGQPFPYGDCSLGNLVFAGSFLGCDRDFNRAVDDYCALLGLAPGLVENVTDGSNAHLVAVDRHRGLLASEAAIVDATRSSHIEDIHLLDRPLTVAEQEALRAAGPAALQAFLDAHRCAVAPNPRLLARLAEADLILYAPGTQHSSLFPSYLTPGVGAAIAGNLAALKVLITNLQPDAEIPDASALDIVRKALYYLREKDRHVLPAPCLITHYVIHDPGRAEPGQPYVPLGRLQNLEDPRLVRIGNFEDGVTGRHDAEKILTPFIQSFFARHQPPQVAVLLLETRSADKVVQTVLEALRGGLASLPCAVSFFYAAPDSPAPAFADALPVPLHNVWQAGEPVHQALLRTVGSRPFSHVLLFESSGTYRGDEIVNLLSLLGNDRLDAVWGSRRLSVRDIRASYRQRYGRHPWRGTLSYLGSHLLSLAYLVLYGRYLTDTLSGVRAVRRPVFDAVLAAARIPDAAPYDLGDVTLNQRLLTAVLRQGGAIFETPVQFLPRHPEPVRPVSVGDGLRALGAILAGRWRRATLAPAAITSDPETVGPQPSP